MLVFICGNGCGLIFRRSVTSFLEEEIDFLGNRTQEEIKEIDRDRSPPWCVDCENQAREIKIPDAPSVFSLYSVPGHKRADQDLHESCVAAATDLVTARASGADVGPRQANRAIGKHIAPALNRCREYGAHDTEPRDIIAGYLISVLTSLGAISEFQAHDVRDELEL